MVTARAAIVALGIACAGTVVACVLLGMLPDAGTDLTTRPTPSTWEYHP